MHQTRIADWDAKTRIVTHYWDGVCFCSYVERDGTLEEGYIQLPSDKELTVNDGPLLQECVKPGTNLGETRKP